MRGNHLFLFFLQTTAVMWHWDLLHKSPKCTFLRPLLHTALLGNVDQIAQLHFPHISFLSSFFLSLPRSVFNPLPPWGLCAVPSIAQLEASLCRAVIGIEWPHGVRVGCPALLSAQLSVCSHGITLQLQWEESWGRDREGETASPKWTWLTYSSTSFVSLSHSSFSVTSQCEVVGTIGVLQVVFKILCLKFEPGGFGEVGVSFFCLIFFFLVVLVRHCGLGQWLCHISIRQSDFCANM